MSLNLEKIDDEPIFDTEHIIMNYLKMNNLNPDCLKGTNIQISQNILITYSQNQNYIQNSQKFASNYFSKLNESPQALDLLSPFISSFPNSDLALFLIILLKQNFMELSQSLNTSSELFEKYKNGILSIYHSVISQEKHPKILENICSCITVLIIIGFQGQWTSGIDQLISAAKQGEPNSGNNLIAALILANIENIYNKLDEKIDNKSSKFILSLIDGYSCVINDYINHLLSNNFSGDKSTFVNDDLFKAFISILQSAKLFKINIIKIHGFLDFLINCISYININQDLIVQICEVFDIAFSYNENGLKYNYEKNFKIGDFIRFTNGIIKNQNFMEIVNCLKLIQNMIKFYNNKYTNKIPNDPKDIQILFAASNIFNSILENFGYIFFIPDLDEIVQEIYNYFINIKIYKITQIFSSSLNDINSLCQNLNYKFENYPEDIRKNKQNHFISFLYEIQNSVLENMFLSNEEINTFNINNEINTNQLISNAHQLDKYINTLLKKNINNDDKIEFIGNCDEFYNDVYDIICSLFDGKNYCEKLCTYLLSSTENKNYITIDGLMNIFNFLSFKIMNDYPDIIFNLVKFIFSKKDILFSNERFILQFIKLLYKESIQITKNKKCLNLIISELITLGTKSDKLNQVIIILINKLILTSYQSYKLNRNDDNINQNINEEKDIIGNIFNVLSNYLLQEIVKLEHIFLYKLIDAFYNSLFYTIELNINNTNSIIEVSEKLIKEANQILYSNNNNTNENILRYIFIIWCIIKNIGKEKKDILFNILNKPSLNNENSQETYIIGIQKNVIKIIESNKNNNFNNNIIDNIIMLNNCLISILKDKAIIYFDYFNQIISLIISMNPKYLKIFSLTLNLYNQILTYNGNTDKYNDVTTIGFDVLNSINSLYCNINSENEFIYLANKHTEFLALYMQKSSYFINNMNNKGIFPTNLDNIINIFDKSNNKEFSINFINLIKFITDFALKNNDLVFSNMLNYKNMYNILETIINHIQYFDATYRNCLKNSFNILLYCVNTIFEEKFCSVLDNIYKDKQLNEIIIKYLRCFKISNANLKNNDKQIKEFMSDFNELYHATNKKKYDFMEKYSEEINNMNNGNMNCNNTQTIKINPHSQIYMDLYAKK